MSLNNIFQLFGGLGLFIFGMKLMSDSLQKSSSTNIREILSSMTKNRFKGILSGTIITSIIQSSSATTVMIVSFVNAGLLKLTEAISIIMGANIGTTFTAWLVSFFGFKFDIAFFALPSIGIGVILYFLNSSNNKSWAEALIGFGILFLGLEYIKNGVPDINANVQILEFLKNFQNKGMFSLLFFIFIGTSITMIVQSSSATVALTITLAIKGWLTFETGAAMVLGENIGTTITAFIASIPANKMAKRAALSHTLFNLIGVFWMILLFNPFIKLVDFLMPQDPLVNIESVRYHLSLFHTLFNIINTFLLVWFIKYLAKIVSFIIKPDAKEEEFHLKYIGTSLHQNPGLRLIEAQKEIHRMGDIVNEMYHDTLEVMLSPHKKMGVVIDKINKYETITDMLEKEISDFLSLIARTGIPAKSSNKISSIFNIANDLERIADHCTSLVKLAQRRYEKKIEFTEDMFEELKKISETIKCFIELNNKYLNFKPVENLLSQSIYFEEKVNSLRDRIKKEHTKLLINGKESVISGIVLMDMITNLEKIGDHSFNISEAIVGEK